MRNGGRLNNIVRHILGLYHGRPRARAFRRHLSERAPREGAGVEVLREAIRIAEGEPSGGLGGRGIALSPGSHASPPRRDASSDGRGLR